MSGAQFDDQGQYRKPTLKEVIRAQVAYLFSRFRPIGTLSKEEQQAVAGEKASFVETLHSYLRVLSYPEPAIIREVRAVTRDIQGEPNTTRMPTPEAVSSRVKGQFARTESQPCDGCREMGGFYDFAGGDAPLNAKRHGDCPWPEGLWLCIEHHGAANWYAHRETWLRNGKPWTYVPPSSLLPRLWRSSAGGDWTPWTDGESMGPMAKWARAFVERALHVAVRTIQPEGSVPVQAEMTYPEV